MRHIITDVAKDIRVQGPARNISIRNLGDSVVYIRTRKRATPGFRGTSEQLRNLGNMKVEPGAVRTIEVDGLMNVGNSNVSFVAVCCCGETSLISAGAGILRVTQLAEGDETVGKVGIVNEEREAYIDPTSSSLVMIEQSHSEIHRGASFMVSRLFSGIVDDGNADILVQVGNDKKLHIQADVAAEGDAHFFLYESPVFNAAGLPLVPRNKDRSSHFVSTANFYHSPVIANEGVPLENAFVPGGSKQLSVGGKAGSRNEFILNTNANYLFRVVNKREFAADISVRLEFYEKA